jgi:hypothetical protein
MFILIIIHMASYKWYQSTFLYRNCGIFFRVETCTIEIIKAHRYVFHGVKIQLGKTTCRKYRQFHGVTRNKCLTWLETSVTPIGTPLSSITSDKICTWSSLPCTVKYIGSPIGLLILALDQPISHLTIIVTLRTTLGKILLST